MLKPVEVARSEALSVPNRKLGRTAAALQDAMDVAEKEGLQRGYDEGFAKGHEEGMYAAADECRDHIERFARSLCEAVARVDAAMEDWYARAEDQLALLAVQIAAQVLGKEIKQDPASVLPFVKQALRQVALADQVRIRLNPLDLDAVRDHEKDLLAVAPSVTRMELTDDRTIPGGCIIESDAGAIDASIRAQLDLILETLREAA